MKIRPVGADLFHADGQADTAKLIVSFRYSSKAPKMHLKLRYMKYVQTRTCSTCFALRQVALSA